LQGVSLTIERGEFVAIMGPSGSGKSTLLHTLGFLDRPDSGQYYFDGYDVSKLNDDDLASLRNTNAGFVFQQFYLLSRMTALENAELPLIYGGSSQVKETASQKLKDVGLADRANHKPNELSGGQQQRVAIARALVNDPRIIFADEPTGNLDTQSEKDILGVLKKLNEAGKTIVMVTHEMEIGAQATRIIRMRDGKIVADEILNPKAVRGASINQKSVDENLKGPVIVKQQRKFLTPTELVDNFKQGFRSIFSNKLRSLLSMLGILIGVTSVIAMLALGAGATESMSERLSSLGTNVLTIRSGAHHMGGVSLESGAITRFTLQDAQAISKLDHVKNVSSSVSGRGQLVYGDKNWNTQIRGVDPAYQSIQSLQPVLGNFFVEEDNTSRKKVVLLGLTVVDELFNNQNPVGKTIKINRINFEVIGVLPTKGMGPGGDRDDMVIIPLTTAMYRVLGKNYTDSIDVEVDDMNWMDQTSDAIKTLIVKRHRLSEDNKDSFNIMNMAEIQQALKSVTSTMTLLLGFIAVISLLVGGIGIMNIMLVSVTERTKEIGLRKAIGARRNDILFQFLTESVLMTVTGGLIGVVFGTASAKLLSYVAGWSTHVSVFSILLATVFSVLVGLGFGLWPAQKAARLNPIEALRYE